MIRKKSAEQGSSLPLKLAAKMQHPTDGEIVFRASDSSPIKLSEVILEFAEDMFASSSTRDEVEKAIEFACLAWNLALLQETKDKKYPALLNALLEAMQIEDKDEEMNTVLLIDALIERKKARYATIRRWINDYQFNWAGKALTVNITSEKPQGPPRIEDMINTLLGN